jgi:molybdopterin-guanine dinucleotide biosynthesis protein A
MQNSEADAIIAKSPKGMQPLCGIYKKSSIPILEKLISEKKFRFQNLFDQINIKIVDFDDESSFENLNFQEEYKKALKKVKNG